ncbi:MAG: hypothetical protein ACREJX_14740 [Polyangiaceae bacterium]
MRNVWVWGGAALVAVVAACATSTAPGGNGQNESDGGNIPLYDAGNTTGDSGTSGACTLGTADHCGTCSTVCPGPTDPDSGTDRICSDSTTTGTCDIICKGEWYDLNGDISDGCEAQDPIVHDSADAAVPETATTGGATVPDPYWYVYGDARQHDSAPTSRTLGREDWYVVDHENSGGSTGGSLSICLGISNFPSDDKFEVCVTNVGNKSIPSTASSVSPCATVTPTTVSPNNCAVTTMASTTHGLYYVRVRKLDGSNSANGYALYIQD